MNTTKRNFLYLTAVVLFAISISNLSAQVIQIDTIEKLQLIGSNSSYPREGNYVLTRDIDASGTVNWNGGRGFQPIGTFSEPFRGTLDGQGYKIIGLYINRPDESNVGIFRYFGTYIKKDEYGAITFSVGKVRNLTLENATIIGNSNVGCIAGNALRVGSINEPGYEERHLIENVEIVNSNIKGGNFLGGIVGKMDEGTLQNCRVQNNVMTGNSIMGSILGMMNLGTVQNCHVNNNLIRGLSVLGGVAGRMDRGTLQKCFVKDIVITGQNIIGGILGSSITQVNQCCSTGLLFGERGEIGGIVGVANLATYSTINQCFSTCWTLGNDKVGGLIGNNNITVSECYSAGFVYGRSNVGGLVGAGDPSKVSSSFYDIEATQQTQSAGGTPLQTDQMLVPDIFQSAGWNYSLVWSQSNGTTRPYLKVFPTTSEELTLTINTENGSVDLQPGSPYYLWSVVKSNPIPDLGYVFVGYELNSGTNRAFLIPIQNPVVLTMSSSTTLQIKFIPDQPILIENISDLQKIGRDLAYPPFWSYVVNSDIEAGETQTWNGGKGFAPIGNNVFVFSGSLEGGNHIVSNLYMNRPSEQSIGIFRYLDTSAKISNLTFSGARITGGESTAALAVENLGSIENVSLINCQINGVSYTGGLLSINRGSIKTSSVGGGSRVICSSDYVGGICAYNESGAMIQFSHADANISGGSYVGGISGVNRGIIRRSYSKGSVSSTASYAGGVAGMNQGTIRQSYSHSNVSCNEFGGGLVGMNSATTEETYSVGSVTPNRPNSGGLIGFNWGSVVKSFWDTQTSGYNTSAGGIGKTTAEMLNRATYEAEGWNFVYIWANDNNTVYPYLLVTTFVPSILNIPLEDAENLIISTSLTVGSIEYQCTNSVPAGNVIISEPLPGTEVVVGYPVNLVVSEGPCPLPLKAISSIEELQMIGTSGEYPLDGGYELTRDIDASSTAGWNNGQGFAPIGNINIPFTGYFDGKGYKIQNIKINRPLTDYIGLFGRISANATIKNLILENASISGKNYTGGLVGACNGGNISNVTVSGVISGKGNLGGITGLIQSGNISNCSTNVNLSNPQSNSNTGGIVGQNQSNIFYCSAIVNINITNTPRGAGGIAGSNNGTISHCTSLGIIKASDNCGGIVGNNGWSVSRCWANVFLDSQNYAGGLVGRHTGGLLNNCFATGTVKSSFYSGGLVGGLFGGTIESCYSIGRVSGVSGYVGGLVGQQSGGEVNKSFWNVITSRTNTSFGGTGKTTAELLNIDTFLNAGWDFNNVWYFPSGGQSYPQLRNVPDIQFISIPRLIDLTQEEANNTLTELGLNRGTVSVRCNTAYPAGIVFNQTPVENHLVAGSYPVDMTVSSGPCPTNVPNLIGSTIEQAEVILANANLLVGNVTSRCSNQYEEGLILAQVPTAGTQVPEGSSVNITVSEGPCMTFVPNTIGLTQSNAETLIRASELTVAVVVECNNEVEAGFVFGQEPSAGTQVITGTKVTIYVSSGPCLEGSTEGEGIVEGIAEGEGIVEGVVEGEGITEGEGIVEGVLEGEGITEGEGEVITEHSADTNGDGKINLTELLRVIQFFNIRGYHCAEGTEDGYAPGLDGDHTCRPHSSDYDPQDWRISLGELLRLIQIFNIGHYYPCPGNSEDGFCF